MIIIKTDLESASTKLIKNHKKKQKNLLVAGRRIDMSCPSKTAKIDFLNHLFLLVNFFSK